MAKFLESGCMHVFAVSGMHVGVAAMLVLGVLRLLYVRPRAARLACIPLLAVYVFVTGMSASALRAFIMAAVWFFALIAPHNAVSFWKIFAGQERGFTEKQKVEEMDRALAQSEGQRGELVSDIAASELQIGEIELKILQLQKDLQREVAKELSEVQSGLFEVREKVQSLESTVNRSVIKAPVSGMVLGLTLHTIGAVIPPGGRLLDVVPQDEKLIIEAQVAPIDIDRVKVGQVAEVRFSVFKSRDLPTIEGTLISVSADRIVEDSKDKKESRGGETAYYLARVEVSSEGLQALRKAELDLVPGMPVEVLINTGARTLVQYLLKPLTDSFKRSFIED